ncbi:MAG: hypothetical protein QOC61_1469 [Acidobacteriota bacterium]|jgi:hypothetical protein|nr:hypothetical protein [Acidobacteriota bacterium]
MKKVIVLAALLIAASACATTTTNTNENANATANSNVSATPAPTPQGVSQADIEAKERQIWDAIKAKNWDAFAANLADDFVIVLERGVETKAQTLDSIKKYDLTEYTFSDIRFIKVDADLAILIYTSTEKSTFGGKPSSGKPSHNASAWVSRGGKWLAVFHQESEAKEMPAGQGGNANANASAANANASHANMNANASASPASSPAAPATATDAEKAVWDAIKAKNADAFTNFLLPDAMEVEPEGIMDRAGSAKGITEFDASKYVLSDFKETKLDSDATLVTYKVKGPDVKGHMTEMYHSTIWTNRASQWKAAFHQGSYAAKGNAM